MTKHQFYAGALATATWSFVSIWFTVSCNAPSNHFRAAENQGSEPSAREGSPISTDPARSDDAAKDDSSSDPFGPGFDPDHIGDDTSFKLTEDDVLKGFPTGDEQMKKVCSRKGQDKVRQVFCVTNPPKITSLIDLQKALGIAVVDATLTGRGNNGKGGNPNFVFTGHSSSLVGHFTSAINPRAIIFTPVTGNANPNFVVMGFQRGEQFAEIIAQDPVTNIPAFFLARFEQACNAKEGGCTYADLLSPAIESNFTSFTLYEDVDVRNTIVDCLQCHQSAGATEAKTLRMQELRNPWTHFFRDNTSGGPSLIADYTAAHGTTETYAGIPGGLINASDPAQLEKLNRDNGFSNQVNEFQTKTIEAEVKAASPGQPGSNDVPGTSATWQTLYDQAVAGKVIPVPFHDVKVTDSAKLAKLTQAYKDFTAGTAPTLPDIRDVFKDANLRDMGFMVKAGLDGQGILINACRQCHDSSLNQTISRARFNVDIPVAEMNRAEKDKAIQRIKLDPNHLRTMPPKRFKSLTADEKDLLIKLLQN